MCWKSYVAWLVHLVLGLLKKIDRVHALWVAAWRACLPLYQCTIVHKHMHTHSFTCVWHCCNVWWYAYMYVICIACVRIIFVWCVIDGLANIGYTVCTLTSYCVDHCCGWCLQSSYYTSCLVLMPLTVTELIHTLCFFALSQFMRLCVVVDVEIISAARSMCWAVDSSKTTRSCLRAKFTSTQ